MKNKKYDFMKKAVTGQDAKVTTVMPKFKAPEKGEEKFIDFPFATDDGDLILMPVEYFQVEYVKNGKKRWDKVKLPENDELVEALVEVAGNPRSDYYTAVLELTGRSKRNKLIVTDATPITLHLNGDKLAQLKTITSRNPIDTIDISVTSSNPKFQQMNFQALVTDDGKQSFLSMEGITEDEKDEIMEECAEIMENGWEAICRELTETQIRTLIDDVNNSESLDEFDEEEDEEESDYRAKRKRKARDEFDEEEEEVESPRERRKRVRGDDIDVEEGEELEALDRRMSSKKDVDDEDEEEEVVTRRPKRL